MRKLILILAIIGYTLTANAFDIKQFKEDISKPLKLDVPEMEAKLTDNGLRTYRQEMELRSLSAATKPATVPGIESNRFTWMRTNPGVKEYKVMDDLTFVGIPVFLAGWLAKSEKQAFRQNDGSRHVLLTEFKTHIDDYTQYFGPAMTVGLKVAGVEGRSDWGRLLGSAAMSYGIMAAFVNGIKYTAKEMRPDGTSANSWPSGHTATSFVGATILHKEYGLTRSPWYSIAGYGVATATGVMRVLNNRHWVSDVLSGAGIGIMSTEIAYALSDVIFKGRGLLRNDIDNTANIIEHPSFFSISMGMGFGSKSINFEDAIDEEYGDKNFNLEFRTSTAVAAEGAYFFNKYVGLGGRLRVNSSPINGWDRVMDFANRDLNSLLGVFAEGDYGIDGLIDNNEKKPQFTIESDHLTEFAADLGVYFNFPLSHRFALGSKLLVGRSIMQELNLDAQYSGQVKGINLFSDDDQIYYNTGEQYAKSWDYFTLSANNTMKFGTGISLTYAYKNNFSWKLFLDYDYAKKTYTMEYNPLEFVKDAMPDLRDMLDLAISISETPAEKAEMTELRQYLDPISINLKKARHTFIIGGSFAISF